MAFTVTWKIWRVKNNIFLKYYCFFKIVFAYNILWLLVFKEVHMQFLKFWLVCNSTKNTGASEDVINTFKGRNKPIYCITCPWKRITLVVWYFNRYLNSFLYIAFALSNALINSLFPIWLEAMLRQCWLFYQYLICINTKCYQLIQTAILCLNCLM